MCEVEHGGKRYTFHGTVASARAYARYQSTLHRFAFVYVDGKLDKSYREGRAV